MAVATSEQAEVTPLARALADEGVRLTAYRGVLTLAASGDEEAEPGAARNGAVVHDAGWLRRVAVTGEDRLRWLSGMVTNHVAGLGGDAGCRNLVLNAQGRIQGDLWAWRSEAEQAGGLEMEMAADQAAALLGHLERFIIMDDVELVPLEGWTALGVTGPLAERVLAALGLDALGVETLEPGTQRSGRLRSAAGESMTVLVRRGTGREVGHWTLWCRAEQALQLWRALEAAGATAVGCETVERLRIVEGMPAFGVDFGPDTLPQETAIEDALHFSKGCYLGQEIVERIHSRGQVHRHVRALEVFPDGKEPVVGTEFYRAESPEKSVAKLTSVTRMEMDGARRWLALGMVRAEAEMGAGELQYADGRARVMGV